MDAAESYRAARSRVDTELTRLIAQFNAHIRRQAATPERWTHVADLGHVADGLAELADFLTPRPVEVSKP